MSLLMSVSRLSLPPFQTLKASLESMTSKVKTATQASEQFQSQVNNSGQENADLKRELQKAQEVSGSVR